MPLLDGVFEALLAVFTLGMSRLSPELHFLMRVFIGIEIVTAAALWFWAQEQVIALLTFKSVRIGLFAMFVLQWPFLMGLFLDTMLWIGTQFSGNAMTVAEFRKPSSFFNAGFRATEPLFMWINNVSEGGWRSVLANLPNIIMMLIAALGIWIAFALVSIHVLIAMVLFWLGGAFLLFFIPLGVWQGTSFLAERATGAVISGGVRLGMMATILGICFPLMQAWALPTPAIGVDPSVRQAFIFAGAAAGVFLLNWIAPSFGASLFEGGPAFSGQGLITGISRPIPIVGNMIRGAADMIQGHSKLATAAQGARP